MPGANAKIQAIYRYPVKGLSPEPLARTQLEVMETLPADRLYAIENGPSGFEPAAPRHQPKQRYLMLMRNERLARLRTRFQDTSHTLTIEMEGREAARGDLRTSEGRVKRLELARELVPNVGVIALLTHPHSPDALEELRDLQIAADTIGQQLFVVTATSDRDFEAAFASIVQHRAGLLLIGADPFLFQSNKLLVALAARYRIPTVYQTGENVVQGGLMSYGASIPDAWRLAGSYAGKILKGAKPAELPVRQPTKFELVINLRTAKALNLDIPPTLLVRADEVSE
jgi:hypothetical protein